MTITSRQKAIEHHLETWKKFRVDRILSAREHYADGEFGKASMELDEISIDDLLVNFEDTEKLPAAEEPRTIALLMKATFDEIGLTKQSFMHFYDEVQIKSAMQNARKSYMQSDDYAKRNFLQCASSNLAAVFDEKSKPKAHIIRTSILRMIDRIGDTRFSEARNNFPTL